MNKILIVGGICSGKSYLTKYLSNYLDSDIWYKEYFLKKYQRFIFYTFNTYDLEKVAFIHPSWAFYINFVHSTFIEEIKNSNSQYVILSNFDKRYLEHFDYILNIYRPNNLEHALKRDSRNIELTKMIDKYQKKEKLWRISTKMIINNDTLEKFDSKIIEWLEEVE